MKRISVVVGAALATLLSGQESAASRPVPKINLPAADQAVPFKQKDPIVVGIFRVSEAAPTSRSGSKDQGWRAGIGFRTFMIDKPGLEALKDELYRRGYDLMAKVAPFASERDLLIKVDANAPYGVVQKVIEQAAGALIYRIWFAAAAEPGKGPYAIEAWLPTDTQKGPPDDNEIIAEIRVLLSWNTQANKLERLFGQRFVPPTTEGNRDLERLIKESRMWYEERGTTDVPLIIDSGPRVPWQYVVDVLSMGRRAGVKRLEFGLGTALEK